LYVLHNLEEVDKFYEWVLYVSYPHI
jgi:hypothetical protein